MNKRNKRIAAGILAAAMLVPMNTALVKPMKASAAYELLGENDFEHKAAPWVLKEQAPAKQSFDIREGSMHILIIRSEGRDREKWDLELVHGGLAFKAGHEYKVSFKVKGSRPGIEIYSFIGNEKGDEYFEIDGDESQGMHLGPHMDGMWQFKPLKTSDDWVTYEGIFKPTQDVDNCQWRFQYAHGTQYQGTAQEGDELWFDDMSIYDTTESADAPDSNYSFYTHRDSSGLQNNYVSVNQLGYVKGLEKKATLGDNKGDMVYGAQNIEIEGRYTYEIVSTADDTVVYTGETGDPIEDYDSGDTVCKIDFTNFDEEGEYYIRIKGKDWRSMPFRIGSDIYSSEGHDMLTNALNYFYQNRSGINVLGEYITSGDKQELEHASGHKNDTGYIQKLWKAQYLSNDEASVTYASSELEASGGWYSSQDHGKYMVEGGISLWTLQNMYERAAQTDAGKKKFADGSGKVSVPEAGNDAPDILDECRYELEFMSKMKVQPDEPTWGKYAGMYYHSIQDIKWEGLAVAPWDYISEYESPRIVRPPTFAATLNYAACAAQAARLWKDYDPGYADELYESAKEAYKAFRYNWYEASPKDSYDEHSLYAPLMQRRTNISEQDDIVLDDASWAACELFVTASERGDSAADDYYKELSDYKYKFEVSPKIKGGLNEASDGSYTLYNEGNTAAAGSMTLLLHKHLLDNETLGKLSDSMIAAADEYIALEEKQGYNIPYSFEDDTYYSPTGLPYTKREKGFEYDSNQRSLTNMMAMAYAFDITGDAKYLNGVATGMDYLLGNNPLSFSYITGCGSYHVKNPSHTYWCKGVDASLPAAPDGILVNGPNAEALDPYMASLGFDFAGEYTVPASERYYADSIESWSSNEASLFSNAALAWVVSFIQDENPSRLVNMDVKGDANYDGEFTVADAVVLQRWLLGDKRIRLANWTGADMNKDEVLDVFDLIQMKKALVAKTANGDT